MLPALLVLAFLQASSLQAADTPASTTEVKPAPKSARVVSVYDGDTFTLDTGDRVRVRTINTSELRQKEAWAQEAKDAAEKFLLGKTVTLEFDPEKPRDPYGRVVAETYVGEESLAMLLVGKGLAHVMLLPPVTHDPAPLLEVQAKARAARVGLWGDEHYQGTVHITSFHANARGNDREVVNSEYLRVCNISGADLNVKGYQIMNSRGKAFVWPDLTIPSGHTVQVHSGRGEDQKDPAKQLQIFLQSDMPIWNNSGDKASIFDAEGKLMDWKVHEVAG